MLKAVSYTIGKTPIPKLDQKDCTVPLVKIPDKGANEKRENYLPEFKARAAIEDIKGEKLSSK